MSAELGESTAQQIIDSQTIGRLGAQMEFVVKQVTEIAGTVNDMNRRLIVVESHKTDAEVEALKTRIRVLEDALLQQKTVMGVADWLPKYIGYLFAGGILLLNWLTSNHIIK